MTSQPPVFHCGIVKQILSGDAVVIRGQPRGGPPKERTICLSNITAPRLARRANPKETKDEPYAWEAREYLRKRLIGLEVTFTVEYTVPGTNREYGCIYIGSDNSRENMTESLISEGLVEVRRGGLKPSDESQQKLIQLEENAKSAGKGKWATGTANDHIRNIKWTSENPRNFVESHHYKPIDAVIEHVRDGCTVRAFLLPNFDYVTVMLSGIKAPMFKMEGVQQIAEEFAEEAKYFTESRLLQRDVKIILEGTSNQNFLGTVLHPRGNITEFLLSEGFARCVDWSMGVVTSGTEKYRTAERKAKENRLRIWKDYKPSGVVIDDKSKNFTAKVVEIVNGDAMIVKSSDTRKIFLASIRPPRLQSENNENATPNIMKDSNRRVRPLYDIPYMFEAREFMRKKLVGKKVNVQIDYIQPASGGFPEKTCCTVTSGNINVAEALVSKGLATVIRHRQDDDQRSAHYDELLSAESRAQKKGLGVHSKKEPPIHRVADLSGDFSKSKQFLPFLQRAGRSEAIVEFVASGSRLRLFIPRETCLITFLISGIECPRASRPAPGGGSTIPSEPYGEEALQFTRELCIQKGVEVEVETIDKGGNFIGWLHIESTNLSIALVEEGLAKVHFTAERSACYKALLEAETKAKTAKLNIWSTYEEPKNDQVVEEPLERKLNYCNVVVTEVMTDLKFYAQYVESGPQLVEMMEQLRKELETNTPVVGAYTPKRGAICAAQFSVDNQWYRAKVEKISNNKASVLYIDYGNREEVPFSMLAALPPVFQSLPAQATLFGLACVKCPDDEDAKRDAYEALNHDVFGKQLVVNSEYKANGVDFVTGQLGESRDDVAFSLISDGILLVENRKEKRLSKLVASYMNAQEKAKSARQNLWRYGDITEDDAREFG